MLLINIDSGISKPLYQQVFEEVKKKIDQGIVKPGYKLPSSRNFARQLGVNRSTVYRAYEELWALGYIISKPGSYSYVRKPAEIVKEPLEKSEKLIEWEDRITESSKVLLVQMRKQTFRKETSETINFIPLSPDPNILSTKEYRKCLNQVIQEQGPQLLQYGDPRGYKPLREYLAERMSLHGIFLNPDEILITNGIQNGLDLMLKLLIEPGSEILVEEPSYSAAIPLFKYYNASIITIPMKETGPDLHYLKDILKRKKPAFFYTIPNFHNPYGISTSQEHRENLLRIAEENELPILEDGFEEEMKYFGKAVMPIKSIDKKNMVTYFGTFSKVLFPGLRVGWVAGDKELIEKLGALKKAFSISGNELDQAALDRYCRFGYYEHHIKQIHRIYRKRMQTAMKAARRFFTEKNIRYTKPNGGYTFWVEIDDNKMSEEEFMDHLKNYNVMVCPGSWFHKGIPEKICFRISIAHRNEEEIEQGIKRISEAVKNTKESFK